jgi:hypothetical protein
MHPATIRVDPAEDSMSFEQRLQTQESMIKVSIVEDDAKLRETMSRYLAGQSGFQ